MDKFLTNIHITHTSINHVKPLNLFQPILIKLHYKNPTVNMQELCKAQIKRCYNLFTNSTFFYLKSTSVRNPNVFGMYVPKSE